MADAGVVHPAFPRYWASAFLADFGEGIRFAAFPLLAAEVSRSPLAVAAATTVQGLPWVLAGLGAGALIDRWDLRKTMAVAESASAALILVLAVAVAGNFAGLPLIYLTALLAGAGSMVSDIAQTTAVPRLADGAALERANGRLVVASLVGSELAGPAAGGWLFGLAAALPFAVNAGSLGVAVLLLLTLPGVFAPRRHGPEPAGRLRAAADVRAGLTWVRHDHPVRDLVAAVGVIAAADGAYLAIFVLYVTRVLHHSPAVYGLLLAVGAIGGVVAGLGCAQLIGRFGTRRTLAGTAAMMAGAQLALGLTSNVAVTAAALACSSGAFAAFNTTSATLRQRRCPAGLLARVNSTYLTVGRSAEAIGALAGGTLAAATSIRAPILAGVVPLLAAGALLGRPGRGRHRD